MILSGSLESRELGPNRSAVTSWQITSRGPSARLSSPERTEWKTHKMKQPVSECGSIEIYKD